MGGTPKAFFSADLLVRGVSYLHLLLALVHPSYKKHAYFFSSLDKYSVVRTKLLCIICTAVPYYAMLCCTNSYIVTVFSLTS